MCTTPRFHNNGRAKSAALEGALTAGPSWWSSSLLADVGRRTYYAIRSGKAQMTTAVRLETRTRCRCSPRGCARCSRTGRGGARSGHWCTRPDQQQQQVRLPGGESGPAGTAGARQRDRPGAGPTSSASGRLELYHNAERPGLLPARRPDQEAIHRHHAALGVPCGDVHQVDGFTWRGLAQCSHRNPRCWARPPSRSRADGSPRAPHSISAERPVVLPPDPC